MKIRVYFPFFPFPVTEGAYLVVADQLRYFCEKGHHVELVCWRETRDTVLRKLAAGPWPARATWRLLECGPEQTRDRVARVVRSCTSSLASPELFHYPPSLLDQLASLDHADLAVYHYSYAYAWLSRRSMLPPESKRVVHYHNLESDGHSIRARGLLSWLHQLNTKKLRDHEQELASHADELWFLSAYDARKLGIGNWRVVPPTFDPILRIRRTCPVATEIRAGFIGGMDFGPNYESALWILRNVAPRLASGGFRGKLSFVGRSMPADLQVLGARYKFVEFKGFVQDIDCFWAGLSFLLAPHIVGSGIRTKILEGMVSGVPVITNSAGARPLSEAIKRSSLLMCHDDPNEWARILLRESNPQMTRATLAHEPVCPALLADYVYREVI